MTTPEPSTEKLRRMRTAIPVAMALILTGAMAGGFAIGRASAPPQSPPECVAALDSADGIRDTFMETLRITQEALTAAVSWDGAGLDDLTTELEDLNPVMNEHATAYQRDAGTCRDLAAGGDDA